MRLVTYNVEYCDGINRGWKYLDLLKYVKIANKTMIKISNYVKDLNPDILGLIEIDSGSIRSRKKSGSEFFANNLEMGYWIEKTKYARKSFYKVLNLIPIVRKQSNAILSKYKLYDTQYYFLSKGAKRLVIHTKVRVAAGNKNVELHLFAVHLSLRRKTREIQLRELGQIVAACPSPKIVFGDFNVFKGIRELDEFIKESDMSLANNGSSVNKTFPSWKPKYYLDHIFVSSEIDIKNYEVLQDANFSDHLPVLIDFEIRQS